MFHIGQKVVCIDDRIGYFTLKRTLTKGQIYTIRGFDNFCVDALGIHLEEVILPNYPKDSLWPDQEMCYRASRFRPVITKSTDAGMAILKKIAADQSKKQVVPITESVD